MFQIYATAAVLGRPLVTAFRSLLLPPDSCKRGAFLVGGAGTGLGFLVREEDDAGNENEDRDKDEEERP